MVGIAAKHGIIYFRIVKIDDFFAFEGWIGTDGGNEVESALSQSGLLFRTEHRVVFAKLVRTLKQYDKVRIKLIEFTCWVKQFSLYLIVFCLIKVDIIASLHAGSSDGCGKKLRCCIAKQSHFYHGKSTQV